MSVAFVPNPDLRHATLSRSIENFVARAIRLYEQETGEVCASSRFGLYVRRWVRWTEAGIPERPNVPEHRKRSRERKKGMIPLWGARLGSIPS